MDINTKVTVQSGDLKEQKGTVLGTGGGKVIVYMDTMSSTGSPVVKAIEVTNLSVAI